MAIQFDVYIDNAPSSFQFASAPVKAGITNNSNVAFTTSQPQGSNMYRVVIYYWSGDPITDSGVLASFQVKFPTATNNATEAQMSIKNVSCSDLSGNLINLQNTSTAVTITSPDIVIAASDVAFTNGQYKKVQFLLNTSLNITNLSLDLSGINLTPDFSTVALVGSAASTHTKSVSASVGRIIINSSSNALLPIGTPIFEMYVAANNSVEKYGYSLNIANCSMAAPNATAYFLPDHCLTPAKGGFDVNNDGEVDVRDITALIDAIMNSK